MTSPIADMHELDVELPDGRTLHVYEAGDPDGYLVVYHHGTPSSGILRRTWAEEAARRGLRLVGYTRAGYGGSSRHRGRSVADVAADIAAVADALGAERFATWGMSGGGPHALACAALLPDRVIAATSVAGAAPYDVEGLDFLAGMGEDNIVEFSLAAEGEDALRPRLEKDRIQLAAAAPEQLRDAMASLLPEVDREALTGETAEYLHGSMTRALADGVDGWVDDDLAFTKPWGFEVSSIAVPTLVMQGDADLMVPFAHGQWLAEAVPGADVRLESGQGHVSLLTQVPQVLDWLLSHR